MTSPGPIVIARIKGGLGNQLFCYAAARRLAHINHAELVLDNVSGFVRDEKYKRKYCLDKFSIPVRKATSVERLEPMERFRRYLKKYLANKKTFADRQYIEQTGDDFDIRLLSLKVNGTLFLDGLWQSELYFKDIEYLIREDLKFNFSADVLSAEIASDITSRNSVALHVRWFDDSKTSSSCNMSKDYFERAVAFMDKNTDSPYYYIFSDNITAARNHIEISSKRCRFINIDIDFDHDITELWLMSLCNHFITANSTFSWWGAWLSSSIQKIIVTPKVVLDKGSVTKWNFKGQLPDHWHKL